MVSLARCKTITRDQYFFCKQALEDKAKGHASIERTIAAMCGDSESWEAVVFIWEEALAKTEHVPGREMIEVEVHEDRKCIASFIETE